MKNKKNFVKITKEACELDDLLFLAKDFRANSGVCCDFKPYFAEACSFVARVKKACAAEKDSVSFRVTADFLAALTQFETAAAA